MGTGNEIGAYAIIEGHVSLGNNNKIYPYSFIGGDAQMHYVEHKKEINSDFEITIGNENFFREFTTVHLPSLDQTKIGDRNIFMAYSHVPHDARIGDNVKVTNNVQIAGFSIIQSNVYLGMSSSIQQRLVIGYGTIVGMGTVVSRSIPPCTTYTGNPQVFRGVNLRGLRALQWDKAKMIEIKQIYSSFLTEQKINYELIKDKTIKKIFDQFEKAKIEAIRS